MVDTYPLNSYIKNMESNFKKQLILREHEMKLNILIIDKKHSLNNNTIETFKPFFNYSICKNNASAKTYLNNNPDMVVCNDAGEHLDELITTSYFKSIPFYAVGSEFKQRNLGNLCSRQTGTFPHAFKTIIRQMMGE